ncbi:MAG TPA: WD40 repeat domain-containing protein [Deinococcales bacterium]|nr:WD40 repeat domain-containing protein [Deinococcales bacterium]
MNPKPALLVLAVLLAACGRPVPVPSDPSVLNGSFSGEARAFAGPRLTAFAPDGSWLVAAGANARRWSTGGQDLGAFDPNPLPTMELDPRLDALAVAPDGTRVAAVRRGLVVLQAVASGATTFGADYPFGAPGVRYFAAWSPDGTRLAVGSSWGPAPVMLLDGQTGAKLAEFTGPPSGDANRLAAWDAIWAMAFAPDGSLQLLDAGGKYWRLDSASGAVLGTVPVPLRAEWALPAFSPDGRLLVTKVRMPDEDRLTVWTLPDLGVRRNLSLDPGAVYGAWVANDGTVLLTVKGAAGPELRAYDPDGQSSVTLGPAGVTVTLAADGQRVAVGDDNGNVRLYTLPGTTPAVLVNAAPVPAAANLTASRLDARRYGFTGTLDFGSFSGLGLRGTVNAERGEYFTTSARLRPAGLTLGEVLSTDGATVWGDLWVRGPVTDGTLLFDVNARDGTPWRLELTRAN